MFVEFISTLVECWARTNFLQDHLKIEFYNYEESYYNIIEDLIYLKYGDEVGALILWYVYDRFESDGELQKLEVTIPGKAKKVYTLKTALDLWNLIDKINKANQNWESHPRRFLASYFNLLVFTGDTFRSYYLVVMSHARFHCATPVKMFWYRQQVSIL